MEQAMQTTKQPKAANATQNAAVLGGALLVLIVLLGAVYLFITRSQLYTDKAELQAPGVSVAPTQSGTLEKMLVQEGEYVQANTVVAQVGQQLLKNREAGIVVSAADSIGKTVNAGETVVMLINPQELRVVAHVDEDKGLNKVQVGQQVFFTVDAFGSKKYSGTVVEISESSRQAGVVFNISDKREIKQFDVKIAFDEKQYAELKNGMSAKVTIYTK